MRRTTPVAVLALAAALLLSAPSAGSDPVDPAEAPQGGVCEAGPLAATPQRSVEEEVARLAASGQLPADQDVVMLNGRGYNYGPTPEQQLDMIKVEALKAEAELLKRR